VVKEIGGGYYSDMDGDSSDEDYRGRMAPKVVPGASVSRPSRPTPPRSPLPFQASALPISPLSGGKQTSPLPIPLPLSAAGKQASPVPKKSAHSDYYDYSDMDDDEFHENGEAIVVPKFIVPEQRGAPLDLKIRQDREVLVGGRNQDYLALAYVYKLHRPYSDHNYRAVCVICHQRPAQDVFFPCEHRCVCRVCIKSEKFVEDRQMGRTEGGYNMCPLCASTVKRILPHEHGKEAEKYWQWVEEIAPELPPGFLRNFRHSASVLEAVYVTGDFRSSDNNCLPS